MQENIDTNTKVKRKLRKRVIAVIIFLLIFLLFSYISLRGEYLEIYEINEDYVQVYEQNLKYYVAVWGINFIILFLSVYISTKFIKKGLKTFFENEKKDIPKLPNKSLSLILGAVFSIITTGYIKEQIMLLINNTSFEINDPIFNMDIGYYMFQKPFIEFILFYIIGILIGLIIYLIVYYITTFNIFFDGIDLELLKKNTCLKQLITFIIIITICVAGITFIKSQDILFNDFMTLEDEETTNLVGASLTDVTIKLWGYRLLTIVIIISVLKAISHFKKIEVKKGIFTLLWVPGYLVVLFLIMLGFKNIVVLPNELDREKEYISYNINNTKKAYNIDIEETEIDNSGTITSEEMDSNEKILNNINIISKGITIDTLKKYKNNLGYYSFNNTKIGKYEIDGNESLVYISPREVINNRTGSYTGKTYEYTHGYSAIITSATQTDELGSIKYIQSDFEGKDNKINVTEPRIYFGLETNNTIITNGKNKTEYDYPISSTKNAEYTYNGEAGLSLDFIDRVILAIKEKNIPLAFSFDITKESKILTNRNIIKRAQTVMPYLVYDEKPYLVIDDNGKLIWVLDAYTISEYYPYSTKTTIEVNGTKRKINYIKNSVKVLIDAYNGTTKFYITDRSDPIVMAYNKIYPSLFVEAEEKIPETISKYIVYPEFLYKIQCEMLTKYHNIQPDVLYRSDDIWELATYNSSKTSIVKETQIDPIYTLVKTDNNKSDIGLITAYTPLNRKNINSYLIGTYNREQNNKLKLCKFKQNNNVLGTMQLDSQIEQDETISKELSDLNTTGSKLIKNMIIVPVENTLLYVEPIYQVLTNEAHEPILKKIIVASGNKLAIGNNLKDALNNLISQNAVDIEIENTEDIDGLINAVIKANNNLEESSNAKDWEQIGKDMKKLQEVIKALQDLKEKEETEIETNNTINSENNILNVLNIIN